MLRTKSASHMHDNSPCFPLVPIKAILLDDNLFDQRRIERMIRESGLLMVIDSVSTVIELSEQLDREKYDLVLLDYRLPVGSGQDAITLVRHHEINNFCTAIMVAGDENDDKGALEMRQACDDFISKDRLDPEILRHTIVDALSERALSGIQHHEDEAHETCNAVKGLEDEIETVILKIRALRMKADTSPRELNAQLAILEQHSIRAWCLSREAKQPFNAKPPLDVLGSSLTPTAYNH